MSSLSILYLLITWSIGICIALALPCRFPAWSRYLFGPALGMIITTEITFWLALIFQLNNISISLGILCSILIAVYSLKKKQSSSPVDAPNFRQAWSFIAILIGIGSVAAYVYFARVLAPEARGWIVPKGGLYGDTAMHLGQITSFAHQGVPIEDPLFAGIPCRYPFLVNFFAACLFKLGMPLRFLLALPQLCSLAAFLTLFYLCARKFTDEIGTFFSFLIFLLGWGLGFFSYFSNALQSGNWTIAQDYTNDLQLFRMHNFMTGLALPERGMLSGCVIGLLLVAWFLYDDAVLLRKRAVLLALFCGILPLWHVHTFIFMACSLALWLILSSGKDWRNHLDSIIVFICITAVVSFPTLLWFSQQFNSHLRYQIGWINNHRNLFYFWFVNTGLVIPLAVWSFFSIEKKYRFIFLPALIFFIVGNSIIFQPWDWDNIKLLSWPFFFAAVLAGRILSRLFSTSLLSKTITFILICTLTASGSLSILQLLSKQYVYLMYDRSDLQLANWVVRNTPPHSVFLVSDAPVHPVTSLTGRTAYLGYPGHLVLHAIEFRPRLAIENRILAGDLSAIKELDVPVDYIVAENSKPIVKIQNGLAVPYRNNKFTVFQLR